VASSQLYRVRTVLSGWQGAPGLNTFYFQALSGGNATDALAAVNRVRGSWDVVKSVLSAAITAQTQGQVDIISDTDGSLQTSFNVTQPAVVTGTCGTAATVAQVAGGLELFTADVVDGRRVRGRSNIGPLCATFTGSILPPTGLNTALDAMGVALVTVSPPATPPLVIWHRPVFNKVTHTLIRPGTNWQVTSSSHASKFFSIRSRRD